MTWHGKIGAAIAGLIGFRLAWGVVGSHHARFATFVRGPSHVLTYLRGQWRGLGHNPLGALSVLTMLAMLLAQIVSGLLSDDDIAFRGPYHIFVDSASASLAIFLHKRLVWVLGALILLHLAAIVCYTLRKGDNLVKPMITGTKEIPPTAEAPEQLGGGTRALLLALAFAGLFTWTALGGPVGYLAPPPAATATPEW